MGELAGVERSSQLVIRANRLLTPHRDNAVEILQFGATPSTVDPGERAVLTFRLKNAQAARIEPEVGALPSLTAGTVGVNPREP